MLQDLVNKATTYVLKRGQNFTRQAWIAHQPYKMEIRFLSLSFSLFFASLKQNKTATTFRQHSNRAFTKVHKYRQHEASGKKVDIYMV